MARRARIIAAGWAGPPADDPPRLRDRRLQWGEIVKDWPEPSAEELAYDERVRRNARYHCPGCGRFTKPPKIRYGWSHYGTRRIAVGVCAACGEFDEALD